MKINWKELFDGVNADWLFKNAIEMDTSPCVLEFERRKVEKILDKRIKEQLEQG